MKVELLDKLDKLFCECPMLCAGPAPPEALDAIRAYAGFELPSDYREFVLRYGAGVVGPYPIYGWGRSSAMGEDETTIIDVTEYHRTQGLLKGTNSVLVVSEDHTGDPFTMDQHGQIGLIDHNTANVQSFVDSFQGLISHLAKKL